MADNKEGIVVLEPGDKPQAQLDEKIAENEYANDCVALLSTPGGRRYVWALLAECGVMEDPFVRGEQDTTAYKIGMQRVGRKVFTDLLNYAPSHYHQMAAENSTPTKKGKTK